MSHRFRVSDFEQLGSVAGFGYRLPSLAGMGPRSEEVCIAEGHVTQYVLREGMTLCLSDIVTHHSYESTSRASQQFSAIMMLQGHAEARLNQQDAVGLRAQGCISAIYDEEASMTGMHPSGQRMRSVNVSINSPACLSDPQLADALSKAMHSPGPGLRHWTAQTALLHAVEQLMNPAWQGSLLRILQEGVSLQLLAHALAEFMRPVPEKTGISARDRQLLERVRERLHSCPGEEHTLEDLARLACMSPSTLRTKFRAAYQCSIFHWLRERRLEVAHQHLKQGWSVQRAAHFVGYRHATNFTTAFRQRYGIAPSELN